VSPTPSPENGNRSSFRNVLFRYNPGRWTKFKNQVIPKAKSTYHEAILSLVHIFSSAPHSEKQSMFFPEIKDQVPDAYEATNKSIFLNL
jgi:hypothetical protein